MAAGPVKPPQNPASKGKFEPYGDGEGWFRGSLDAP